MKEHCACCGLDIFYDVKPGGKLVNVLVDGSAFLVATRVQMALLRTDIGSLPTGCKECGENCQAKQIIGKVQKESKPGGK